MGVSELEKVEGVKLYFINERQVVTEDDSPVIGDTMDIAERISVYEFFHSDKEASDYVEKLQKVYRSRNPTLQPSKDGSLRGNVEHVYSHSFTVAHSVHQKIVLNPELPSNLEELLREPRRTITLDETRRDEHPFPFEKERDPYTFKLF